MKIGAFSREEQSDPLIKAFSKFFCCDVLPESEEPKILRLVICSRAYEF